MAKLNISGNKAINDKFLYIEPNESFGDELNTPVPLENLSICIALSVEYVSKKRGALKENGVITGIEFIYNNVNVHSNKSFLGGTECDDKEYWLTSEGYGNYTINSLKDKGTSELFTIESINVSYNSYMVPEVVIKFTDIKGAALHGAEELAHGKDGEYKGEVNDELKFLSCFFTVPYPKFKLQIKGYYGQPVSYELTCSKFDSQLDSRTGNFNGVATMIGYSFALISDVTICSLMAAPYATYYGKEYWKEQKKNGRFKFSDGSDFLTTEEIIAKWYDKMDYVNSIREEMAMVNEQKFNKNGNSSIQEKINEYSEAKFVWKQFLGEVIKFLEELKNRNPGKLDKTNAFKYSELVDYTYDEDLGCIYYVHKGRNAHQIQNAGEFKNYNTIWGAISNFASGTILKNDIINSIVKKKNERLIGYEMFIIGNDYKDLTTEFLYTYKDTFVHPDLQIWYWLVKMGKITDNATLYAYPKELKLLKMIEHCTDYAKEIGYYSYIEQHSETLREDPDGWKDINDKGYYDAVIQNKLPIYIGGYDFGNVIKEIDKKLEREVLKLQTSSKQQKNEIDIKLMKILGFVPSIKNITKILFAHLETLLYMYERVRAERENDSDKILKTIGIFPQYTENVLDGNIRKKEEKWIGLKYPNLAEVKMVQGFINGIDTVQSGENLPIGSTMGNLNFTAIAPCDIAEGENPFVNWKHVERGNITDNMMLWRLQKLFNIGLNRCKIDPSTMGIIDAKNYFNAFPDGHKDVMTKITRHYWTSEFLKKNFTSEFDLAGEISQNKQHIVETFKNVFYKFKNEAPICEGYLKDDKCYFFWIYEDGELDDRSMLSVIKGVGDKNIITVNSQSWGNDETDSCFRFQYYINSYTAFIVRKITKSNLIENIKCVKIEGGVGTSSLPNNPLRDSVDTYFESLDICNEYKVDDISLNRIDKDNKEDRYIDASTGRTSIINFIDDVKPYNTDPIYRTIACLKHMSPDNYTIITIPSLGERGVNNGILFKEMYYQTCQNMRLKALMFLLTFNWGRDYDASKDWKNEKQDNSEGYQEHTLLYKDCKLNYYKFIRNVKRCLMFEEYAVVDGEDFRYIEVLPLFFVLKIGALLSFAGESPTYGNGITNKFQDDKNAMDMINNYTSHFDQIKDKLKDSYRNYLIYFFQEWVKKDYTRWDNYFSNADNDEKIYYYYNSVDKVYLFRDSNQYVDEINRSFFKLVVLYKYHYAICSNWKGTVTSVLSHLTTTSDSNKIMLGNDKVPSHIFGLKVGIEEYLKNFEAQLKELFAGKIEQFYDSVLSISISPVLAEMYLNAYRYLAELWDRWILNEYDNGYNSWTLEKLFNDDGGRIHFIDSSYNNVGDLALIDLAKFVDLLQSSKQSGQLNLSLLSFLSYLYRDNNCALYNIQNFYHSQNGQNISQIFTPLTYQDVNWSELKHNSDLVVMFTYQVSESAEDSFNIVQDEDENLPDQFQYIEGNYHIPAIGVTYGSQNQNYFTDIQVSTYTPTATEQVYQSLMRIADENSRNAANDNTIKVRTYGQDAWQIFGNYAYECSVTMLGCPWIQPLMYFQLLNVPLFRGAYIIQKVQHSIQNGKMMTTFSGMRVSNKTVKRMTCISAEGFKEMQENVAELMKTEIAMYNNDCSYMFFNPYDESDDAIGDEKYVTDAIEYFDKTIKLKDENNKEKEITHWQEYGAKIFHLSTVLEVNDKTEFCKYFVYLLHNYWVLHRESDSIEVVFYKFFNVDYLLAFESYDSLDDKEKVSFIKEKENEINKIVQTMKKLFAFEILKEDDDKIVRVDGFITKEANDDNYVEVKEFNGTVFCKGFDGQEKNYLNYRKEYTQIDLTFEMVFSAIQKSMKATKILKDTKLEIEGKNVDKGKYLLKISNKNASDDVRATMYDLILQTYSSYFSKIAWIVSDANSGDEMWTNIHLTFNNQSSITEQACVAYITDKNTLEGTIVTSYDNLHPHFYTSIMKKYSLIRHASSNKIKDVDEDFIDKCINFASMYGKEDKRDEKKNKVIKFFNTNQKTKGIIVKPCVVNVNGSRRRGGNITLPADGYKGENRKYTFNGNPNISRKFKPISTAQDELIKKSLPYYIKNESTLSGKTNTLANSGDTYDEFKELLLKNGFEPLRSNEMGRMMTYLGYHSSRPYGSGHSCAKGVRERLQNVLKMTCEGSPSFAAAYIYALEYWGFTAIHEGMPSEFKGAYLDGDIIVIAGLTEAVGKKREIKTKKGEKKIVDDTRQYGHIQIHYQGSWYCDVGYHTAQCYTKERYCYIFRGIDNDYLVNNNTQSPSGSFKILIDNGHGENTPGKRSPDKVPKGVENANYKQLLEWEYNREIAKRVVAKLNELGYDAVRIVTEDTDISVETRAKRVNEWCKTLGKENVLFVSIHCDAAGNGDKWWNVKGGWSALTSKGQTESDKLAEYLYAEAERQFGVNRVIKETIDGDKDRELERKLTVLYKPKCVSVLTENFHMDCYNDYLYLMSESGKAAIVDTHVYGIINYITAKSPTSNGKNYRASNEIIDAIKHFEGFMPIWYPDSGSYAIGYGFRLNDELIKQYPRSAGNTCTGDEIGKYLGEDRTDIQNSMTKVAADNYMRKTLLPRLEAEFNRIMAGMPSYTQCQLDAIFCLMYNIGTVGLESNSPKLMKALRENDIDNIIKEMDHGGESHIGRRNWERQLFKENQYPPYPK